MKIEKMFLTPNIYSRPQTALKKVSKIALHYVGNPRSTASANRNYFESLKDKKSVYASSHYIIGLEGEIIMCIPENEIAYCTNQANSYSISIECCHPDTSGKFNDKTTESLVELCSDLCRRYNLDPINDIIRHFDVTGKKCPLYWVNNPKDFIQFKNKVKEKLSVKTEIKTLDEAVKKLLNIGIISTSDFWFNAVKCVNYLDSLLINSSNLCRENKVSSTENACCAVVKIQEAGIIKSPDYWLKAIGVCKYLDKLIINISERI